MSLKDELFEILKIRDADVIGTQVKINLINGSTVTKNISALTALEKTKVIKIESTKNPYMIQATYNATFLDGRKEINYGSPKTDWTDSRSGEKYRKMLLDLFPSATLIDSMSNQQIAETFQAPRPYFDTVYPFDNFENNNNPYYKSIYEAKKQSFVNSKVVNSLSSARFDNYKAWIAYIQAQKGDSGLTLGSVAKFIDDAIDEVPILGTVAPVVGLAESLKHPTEAAAIAFLAGATTLLPVAPVVDAPLFVGPPAELAAPTVLETALAAGGSAVTEVALTTGAGVVAGLKDQIIAEILPKKTLEEIAPEPTVIVPKSSHTVSNILMAASLAGLALKLLKR